MTKSKSNLTCKQKIFKKEMHKFKHGTLKSGSGNKVTSEKQAKAIAMSVSREKCG